MTGKWGRRTAAMQLLAVLLLMLALVALLFWPNSGPSAQECREARAWSTPQCREAAQHEVEEGLHLR